MATSPPDPYTRIRYEPVEQHVVRLVLDRPAQRNAQDATMTYEIDRALTEAARDDAVKVVVLSGEGPHFGSGHDQGQDPTDHAPLLAHGVSQWAGYDLPGAEGQMARNRELYFETTWRWRNFPKVLLGQVHGKAVGGALMMLSACDLIVASEDALFADPTVNMGVPGVEYLGHPWDLGPRKAKELLFTGDFLTARDLERAGFVNRVVPREQLEQATLELARRVAAKPSLGLRLAKEAVNRMQDTQGIHAHLTSAFSLTTLGQYQLVATGAVAAKQATDKGLFTAVMREPAREGGQ